MDRWQGRVALVTGASAGIGAAIAGRLVESGMIVVGCARNIDNIQAMSEELKTSNCSLHALRCDLRKEEEILAMFSEIKSQHGGVDVCVNNAGPCFNDCSILYGQTEQWRKVMDVNVMASACCTREAIKSMRERGVDDGHIVQIGSYSAFTNVNTPWPALHWFKAAKVMLLATTDCLRMELRAEKSRIKVSAVHPGLVDTEYIGKMIGEEQAKEVYKTNESISTNKIADAALSVLGTTEDVEIENLVIQPTSGYLK